MMFVARAPSAAKPASKKSSSPLNSIRDAVEATSTSLDGALGSIALVIDHLHGSFD
jgi:hypothetical protein